MMRRWRTIRKWLTPGLGIKRWLALFMVGMTTISFTFAQILFDLYHSRPLPGVINFLTLHFLPPVVRIAVGLVAGILISVIALRQLSRRILAPYVRQSPFIDMMYNHSIRERGIKLVALGGGTGLPSVLRGFKSETSNITAIATVADDGGSSGKLRREMGVLPPGDLRNNIAALADDEQLMTQLFQYRFAEGGLEGHSFGNLFLTALTSITGSMDKALIEAGHVLAIQGQVLPSTLQDVVLIGEVRNDKGLQRIEGESQITEAGKSGKIERVLLSPESARAYPESIRAILSAELIIIGPGSLYTSIMPNLLVKGIRDAIHASGALCIYVCNVATQRGETDDFTVADHVLAIERHIGAKLFSVILANNVYPAHNKGANTHYVQPAPPDHPIRKHYRLVEADLTDEQQPWRHDSVKLRSAIMNIITEPIGAEDAIQAFVIPPEG